MVKNMGSVDIKLCKLSATQWTININGYHTVKNQTRILHVQPVDWKRELARFKGAAADLGGGEVILFPTARDAERAIDTYIMPTFVCR